jgi:cytochrome c5
VTRLTAAEQQRFAAGQEVYGSICFACHQEDGKGKEKMAPTLVGSPLALGPAGIPVRILLQGKEGPVGLMPPLGQMFSDDQIAAVLTFIRRQWGNAASPIDAATVKDIRAATAGRTRPWTNDELEALMSGAGRGRFGAAYADRSPDRSSAAGRRARGRDAYHWLVVIIASCGWLFDCMDQRLFILARESALKEFFRTMRRRSPPSRPTSRRSR